jgi:penicillin amidase
MLRRPVPRSRGRTVLSGLQSKVEIIRDRWGVPHIYASNLRDLFFASGYAQAQDRLWHMDFNRRLGSGRLSEVLGEPAVEVDRLIRRIGFRRASERDWADALDREKAMTESFSAGVNAYIEGSRLPLEFSILRYKPEPWHPVDCLTYGRFMGWTLAGNWDSEILRSWTAERFGAEMLADLTPGYPEGGPLIVPPGAEATGCGPDLSEDFRGSSQLVGAAGGGLSNNWAVSGEKSVTGRPILANDPHLPLTMPSIWWEVHLDSPELKAAGAGLPAVPGVVIGHNDNIAWGITASMTDGDDLFVEKVNPDNPAQYEFQGEWVDGEIVREEIKVKGRDEPVVEDVLVTRHGPVISPAVKGETRTLALQTIGLEPSHQMEGILMLMAAQGWDEFTDALRLWPAPPQNVAYADVDGNVGYHMAGLVPIRAKGHGVVPAPGWTGEYEWKGFIPHDELPQAYNPPANWVASANNKITEDDYPYFLSADWADSGRQRRIIEMLEGKEKLSVEDFKEMQADQLSIPARDLVPRMLEVQPGDQWERRALTFLRAWDMTVAADSVAACVFEVCYSHLVRRALEEKLGSWADYFAGRGLHPVRHQGSFFHAASSWLLGKMRDRPDWFDGKTWDQAMHESLASAVAQLRELLGDDVSRWQWGRLHVQRFSHPLGQVRGLDRIFNRGPVPVGGDANTVWQASYAPYEGYDLNSFTASWRQIIDLQDFNRSQATLPSGQSGHPGSRHYGDMIGMWQRVKYHPMPWDRDEVETHARGRLEMTSE